MARTTAELVEGIIEVDSDISLTPFITIANELVTELCTNSGYSDTRLTLVETWLAGHFYGIRDQQIDSEKIKTLSTKFQYEIGLIFYQTKQGQTAMALDTDGNLAALSKRIEAGKEPGVSITWLGTDYDVED